MAAAGTTFAQSSVTLDGYMDRAYLINNSTDNTADLKTFGSASGTSTIGIKVNQDLGGGLSSGVSINTDFADLGGASQGQAVATAQGSGFANGQSFVHLTSKSMGVLRLGAPNTLTLTNVTGVASPAFSTGVGSVYSTGFSIANGLNSGTVGTVGTVNAASNGATGSAGARAIRIANTIQYTSPDINGIRVSAAYTGKNNNLTADGGVGNTVGVTELSARYTAGAIDAMYTTIKYDVGSNGTRQTAITNAATPAFATAALTVQDQTQNLLGLAYTLSPTMKLHAGFGTFESSNNAVKGSSQQFGASYTTGAWNFMGQIANVNDKATTNNDRKMTGLGLNYNLSKTTRAYVRYDTINRLDNKTAVAGSEVKRTAIGMAVTF